MNHTHNIADVAKRLDVTTHSLYAWVKKFGPDSKEHQTKSGLSPLPHPNTNYMPLFI